MTEFLFRQDSYLQSTTANVVAITPEGGIVLDRTLFYAASGGQPGDSGALVLGICSPAAVRMCAIRRKLAR